MTLFFIIIFGIYFCLTTLLIVGFRKSLKVKVNGKGGFSKISVIIAFKDEEHTIVPLLRSLKEQDYPNTMFEVILVDDHSVDKSAAVIFEEIKSLSNFRLMAADPYENGKKRALDVGIKNSFGEIIVTTDADCIVQPRWLLKINSRFISGKAKMIFGLVKIESQSSFFSKLQVLEFSSLIGSGAATLSFGLPSMCNGANLAFLKSAFREVDGYHDNFQIASGDDEFLMRKIHAEYPGSIYFMNDPETIVTTKPQTSLAAFINQRLRWAGKWPHNTSVATKLLGWFIIAFQASYLALIIVILIKSISPYIALSLIAAKMILELTFLLSVNKFLKTTWRTLPFLVLQLIYPIYVVSIGLISSFTSYTWKGRKYQKFESE